MTNLFLASWADISEIENQDYIDYDTLINSDDEFLAIESFFDESEFLYV